MQEKIVIEIKTSNDAFQDGNSHSEIARILRQLADDFENNMAVKILRDINGNTVGSLTVTTRSV